MITKERIAELRGLCGDEMALEEYVAITTAALPELLDEIERLQARLMVIHNGDTET